MNPPYIGRFAPSPSGPLHIGSLVAAMASYLDAKAHHGQWRLRIEDIDEARSMPGVAQDIATTLHQLGMQWDGPIRVQSQYQTQYQAACDKLIEFIYPCACTRREIADSRINTASDGATIYPGTCRHGLPPKKTVRALRLRIPDPGQAMECIRFKDRGLGWQTQHLAHETGDFVLKRADGYWAYQLAVVVDDAEQGITHIVRGVDLLDSTPRQIYLQRLLGYPTPYYWHIPLVRDTNGDKLSKQNGATALNLQRPLEELHKAATYLALPINATDNLTLFWENALSAWQSKLTHQHERNTL